MDTWADPLECGGEGEVSIVKTFEYVLSCIGCNVVTAEIPMKVLSMTAESITLIKGTIIFARASLRSLKNMIRAGRVRG